MSRSNEVEKVKCGYCEYFGLTNPKQQTGFCLKDKTEKHLSEPRLCKMYNLAPIHNVQWRREQIKNGT